MRIPVEQLRGLARLVVAGLRQVIPRGAQPHPLVTGKLDRLSQAGGLRQALTLIIDRESAVGGKGRLYATRNGQPFGRLAQKELTLMKQIPPISARLLRRIIFDLLFHLCVAFNCCAKIEILLLLRRCLS